MGLSSGISWLAWAMQKKVFMIANFTDKEHEFQTDCIRITDTSVCHGCWHKPIFKFDKGDYWFCPENADTPQAFECHKAISAERVIEEIKKAGF
jgi:autotransporter strand-loop-strand O-heptosyltransferase